MKKFTIYIATMLVMLMAASCAQEEVETIVEQQRKLTLTFNMEDSRSRALAEDALNMAENKVDRADVFFFDNNGTYLFHELDLVPTTPTQANDGSWKMNVNVTVPPGITFNGSTYQVYVLANAQVASDELVDRVSALGKNATIADLQALTFTSALETQITEATRFIMDGVDDVTISAKQEVSGEIPLVRAAAKVGLNLEVFESIEGEDGKTYVPAPNSVKVSYHNGVKTFGITPAEFFNTEQWQGAATSETAEGGVYQVAIDPFYSYPLSWDEESDHEPYMMLQMNWGVQSGSDIDYVPYYYRIPVNRKFTNEDGDLALERNNAYLINLEIGVLGSTDPGQVVTLESGYEIMNWGTLPINTEVRDYKYLVVDEHEVEIFNKNSYEIAFASSHPITLEIESITKWDYSKDDAFQLTYVPSTNKAQVAANAWDTENKRKFLTQCSVTESSDGKNIVLTHNLVNEDSNTNSDADGNKNSRDDYDYVPYTIKVKVTNGFYTEYITYTQYPEIYIEAEKNEGGNIVSDRNTDESDDKGYVFVYNNQLNSGSDWQVVRSCLDGGNNNPNMYTINVSALQDNSSLYIGDPRVTTSVKGSSLGLSNRFNGKTLDEYYPTRTDDKNIIAPEFRMASSYGKCGSAIDHDEAKKRCAAYQEYGYPAGRWRLPTVAEFEYVQELSDRGVIPQLYSDDGYYWTATVVYQYGQGESTRTRSAFVRCVYDEWYWGNEKINDMNVYTWGD